MVCIVLHNCYLGFANVRLATIPSEDGQAGELRISSNLDIQHRIYKPSNKIQARTYLSIHGYDLDETLTRIMGCDGRLVTVDGYEYWLRFPSDADAVIFARYLDEHITMYHFYSSGSFSGWLSGPWTIDEVTSSSSSEGLECRCHQIGHIRYQRDYNEDGFWEIISTYCRRNNIWLDWSDHQNCSTDEHPYCL